MHNRSVITRGALLLKHSKGRIKKNKIGIKFHSKYQSMRPVLFEEFLRFSNSDAIQNLMWNTAAYVSAEVVMYGG